MMTVFSGEFLVIEHFPMRMSALCKLYPEQLSEKIHTEECVALKNDDIGAQDDFQLITEYAKSYLE
jgi:hypothetical protein